MIWYHRNDDPAAVFRLSIDKEAVIRKINIQESHYQIVSGEMTDSRSREYIIRKQDYDTDTGKLILYSQENNLQEMAFEVNLMNYVFEQTYPVKN
jgi:hypothetical protein